MDGLAIDSLWFEVPSQFSSFLDDSCDGALVGLLAVAMQHAAPLVVDGTLSERLHWGVRRTVIPVVSRLLEGARAIEVTAAEIRQDTGPSGDAVITGLSCGVDSLAVCADFLLDDRVRPGDRVTHFLFNEVGAYRYAVDRDVATFVADSWRNASMAAAALGRPVIRVRSNLDAFYDSLPLAARWFGATAPLRNAAVALVLQRRAKRFLYASGYSWNRIGLSAKGDLACADPIVLPALSTERLSLVSVGSQYDRIEKTARIADLEVARKHLMVCWHEAANCGECEKCLRTLLILELLGKLDQFGGAFDLSRYDRRVRDRYLVSVLTETDSFHPDAFAIRDFMREVGFRLSWSVRAQAGLVRAWRALPRTIRRPLWGPLHAVWTRLGLA